MNWHKKKQMQDFHGISRSERLLKSLLPDSVVIDERSLSDLLAYGAAFSKNIRFVNEDNEFEGDWSEFFEKDVSVFLALLMTTNLEKDDLEIQELIFLSLHLVDSADQVNNFNTLISKFLNLSSKLNAWYVESITLRKWGDESRIELELEKAVNAQEGLGIQMRRIAALLKQVSLDTEFPIDQTLESEWKETLEKLHPVWQIEKEVQMPMWVGEELIDRIKFGVLHVKETYQLLFATMAYILEIAPRLFEKSITQKNDHKPELGLFISFLKLFQYAQDHLNTITSKHLHHYYEDILDESPKQIQPDRTFVSFTLAAHKHHFLVSKGTLLYAGTNKDGIDSFYETDNDLLVTPASIKSLKTLFISKNPLIATGSSYKLVTDIYSAPIANSADGLGSPFVNLLNTWPILGEDQFEKAKVDTQMVHSELGFAIASSILLLQEGERVVNVDFNFTDGSFNMFISLLEDIVDNWDESEKDKPTTEDIFYRIFDKSLKISLSVEEGWLDVYKYAVIPPKNSEWGKSSFTLQFTLPRAVPAITRINPKVHGTNYDTNWPVLQVFLNSEENMYNYSLLRDLKVDRIKIKVNVSGLKSLALYNDVSMVDASSPFQPFGPVPSKNGSLLIGSAELFSKKLSHLDIIIDWNNLPELEGGFSEYYEAYKMDIQNESFKVKFSALSNYEFHPKDPTIQEEINLFETKKGETRQLRDSKRIEEPDLERLKIRPDFKMLELPEYSNRVKSGFFRLQLSQPQMAFGHAIYPRIFARAMAENARPRPFSILPNEETPLVIPNEPFLPIIDRLSINYTAETEIKMNLLELNDNNKKAKNKIFRIHPFGQDVVFDTNTVADHYLLPQFDADGYLFIGLENLRPPQTISIFFNIQESKKDFNRTSLDLEWSYLVKNNWLPFSQSQILYNSTESLSTSGIVELSLPSDIDLDHQIMTSGLHWIRISGYGNMDILGRCMDVQTQAVRVTWVNNGDTDHLKSFSHQLPPITALKDQTTEIASVSQLTNFFGGKDHESTEEFYMRVSERLRHKNRAVNIWDYERLVLEKFPSIYQVKCIGQEGNEDILRPGQVVVVIAPRITESDLEPKMGYHILEEVKDFLAGLATPFSEIHVINPTYERVKVSCQIKLKKNLNHSKGNAWRELHEIVRNFLCPWLKGGALSLGGSINKNQLFSILTEHQAVQFITSYSIVHVFEKEKDIFTLADTARKSTTNSEYLMAYRPWSLLVPVEEHQITFIDSDDFIPASLATIEGMRLGTDFIVLQKDQEEEDLKPNEITAQEEQEGDSDSLNIELPNNWL